MKRIYTKETDELYGKDANYTMLVDEIYGIAPEHVQTENKEKDRMVECAELEQIMDYFKNEDLNPVTQIIYKYGNKNMDADNEIDSYDDYDYDFNPKVNYPDDYHYIVRQRQWENTMAIDRLNKVLNIMKEMKLENGEDVLNYVRIKRASPDFFDTMRPPEVIDYMDEYNRLLSIHLSLKSAKKR